MIWLWFIGILLIWVLGYSVASWFQRRMDRQQRFDEARRDDQRWWLESK